MATLRQKQLARKIIETSLTEEPLIAGRLLKSTGYSPSSQNEPKRILESQGVQEELELLGFTETNAMRVLGNMLKSKMLNEMIMPEHQIKAAQEVFKVRGTYAAEKHTNLNINVTPIYAGNSVQRHDGDQKDILPKPEN